YRPTGTYKGSFYADGGTYDIYETLRVNQPSIIGDATFKQYWSVRQTKRTSGTVSVSQHFRKWESLGMPMGKMYETALTVEGYRSNGSANVFTNQLMIGR
ncbi:glycoside hydrolase family 11 protein, partial [Bacillus pumilus]